jgi:glutathione S-transferase
VQHHHRWVAERIEELDTPLLVCEPVLAEAMYLLARFSRAHDALFGLLENGALTIAFRIDEHTSALRKLHQKYRDRPNPVTRDAGLRPSGEICAANADGADANAGFRFGYSE